MARRICIVFVDGLGIGDPSPETNPLVGASTGVLALYREELPRKALPRGGMAVGIDACLGVEGIPQSATGQTTLLTGVNGARLVGRHLPGFPNRTLRRLLFERSLLRIARQMGLRAAFVNAYTRLTNSESFEDLLPRVSATTMACLSAGQAFRTLEDLREGRAVYQDFTNEELRERGFHVPLWSPDTAGRILAEISAELELCLYEFFRTDRVGHKGDLERAKQVIAELEEFVDSLLSHIDFREQTVLVVSDHGNIEDLATPTHTRNLAFAAAWGWGAEELVSACSSLEDVHPAILRSLAGNDGFRAGQLGREISP